MSDLVVVMNDGKIVQAGAAKEIYEKPNTDFVASFIGETNLLSGVVIDQGADGSVVRTDTGITLTTAAKLESDSRVTLSIRPEHISVSSNTFSPVRENQFQANVLEWVYSGATTRGLLGLGDMQLIVRVPGAEALQGGKVEIYVNPARAVPVRR